MSIVIVCSCNVVRDDEIRSEVRLGASTVDEVAMRCGAGSRCGGCRPLVGELLCDEVTRCHHASPAGA